MKTKLFFLAAMATFALTSCVNDEFIGDPAASELGASDGSIGFGFNVPAMTRGNLVGSDAATKLQSKFVVYGTKHASAEAADAANDEVVFKNYVVEYSANTAGTRESNTHNWDYVGKTPYASGVTPVPTSQTIKYWDYSAANGYTFYAFAADDQLTASKVTFAKTTAGSTVYDKGYTVTTASGIDLDKVYFSDRTLVSKSKYQEPVVLTFRNLSAKVRVGFYETIPGYKVKIDRFYFDTDAAAAVTTFTPMENENEDNFVASFDNVSASAANTLTVTYNNATDPSIENRVKVTNTTATYLHTLTLGENIQDATQLATSASTPTWDQDGGLYTTVFPVEANVNPMLIKVDYTITSEDTESNPETIEIKNARVIVPAQYMKWKSNFAYTYLFKISDATNGTSGTVGTDPEGLFPITFDAIAVNAEDRTQETITSFGDYSITTYANGSKVVTNNEYKVGEDIYVVKVNNETGNVLTHTFISDAGNCAQVYSASTTGDAINEATVLANLTGSYNGITLTAVTPAADFATYAPAADGTNYNFGYKGSVKFTPAAAGKYVYVSTRTPYVAPTYTAVGVGAYSPSATYYFKTDAPANIYYAASGITSENFATYKASLYTMTAAGTPGEYDVKVMTVVE